MRDGICIFVCLYCVFVSIRFICLLHGVYESSCPHSRNPGVQYNHHAPTAPPPSKTRPSTIIQTHGAHAPLGPALPLHQAAGGRQENIPTRVRGGPVAAPCETGTRSRKRVFPRPSCPFRRPLCCNATQIPLRLRQEQFETPQFLRRRDARVQHA